jgi:hypothetical protein
MTYKNKDGTPRITRKEQAQLLLNEFIEFKVAEKNKDRLINKFVIEQKPKA